MKVDLRRSQTLIKKKKKNTMKKPANNYNSWGKGSEAHWLVCGV